MITVGVKGLNFHGGLMSSGFANNTGDYYVLTDTYSRCDE